MSKKQTQLLTIVFIILFIVMTLSTAFAYFVVVPINRESAQRKATSATMPTLVFNAGEGINIHANSLNFAKDMPSLVDETLATVTLIAGSEHNAEARYNVKLNIDINNFVYTKGKENPELLLIITDNNNELVKEIPGLEYKKVADYEGFDITGVTGKFDIALNKLIQATDTTIHNWNIKVMFINYDFIQDINGSKTLKGYITLEPVEEENGNI